MKRPSGESDQPSPKRLRGKEGPSSTTTTSSESSIKIEEVHKDVEEVKDIAGGGVSYGNTRAPSLDMSTSSGFSELGAAESYGSITTAWQTESERGQPQKQQPQPKKKYSDYHKPLMQITEKLQPFFNPFRDALPDILRDLRVRVFREDPAPVDLVLSIISAIGPCIDAGLAVHKDMINKVGLSELVQRNLSKVIFLHMSFYDWQVRGREPVKPEDFADKEGGHHSSSVIFFLVPIRLIRLLLWFQARK